MNGLLRIAALAIALACGGCVAIAPSPPIPPEEEVRLDTDGDCRNATPGNRLAFFRCTGDYDSFD